MRWLMLILSLCAGAASAQITTEQRFQDCVEVRGPSYAYQDWLFARCQRDQSCSPFDVIFHQSDSLSACLFEGYTICQVQKLDDPDGLKLCVAEVDDLVLRLERGVDLEDLEARLSALAEKATGFKRTSLERRKDEIKGGFEIGCEKIAGFDAFGLPKDVFCSRFQRVHRASRAHILEAYITRQEAAE